MSSRKLVHADPERVYSNHVCKLVHADPERVYSNHVCCKNVFHIRGNNDPSVEDVTFLFVDLDSIWSQKGFRSLHQGCPLGWVACV
jgi:hypothetical protein